MHISLKFSKVNYGILFLLLIIVLGFTLRMYNLSYKSLWLDETESLFYGESSLDYIIFGRGGVEGFVAPLYYIILHFFLYFGQSEFVIRLPSVFFGVLAVFLMYMTGKMFFSKRDGLISAFLLSISTIHIHFSQEARMYSLSMALGLLSLFLFYKALKENSWKLWIGVILSIILGILSHYFMIFVPFVLGVFLILRFIINRSSSFLSTKKGDNKNLFFILGLVAISIIFILLLQQMLLVVLDLIQKYYPNISWGLQSETFFEDLFSYLGADRFLFFSLRMDSGFINNFSNVSFLFLLTFVLGLVASINKYRKQSVLLLIWVLLPVVTVFILTISLGYPIADVKYLLFVLPGYLIGVSRGVSSIAKGLVKWGNKLFQSFSSIPLSVSVSTIALIIMLIFAGLSAIPLEKYYRWEINDWRSTGEYLEANTISGDTIIVEPKFGLGPIDYYYDADLKGVSVLSTHENLDEIRSISSTNKRVWFVLSGPEEEIEDWVRHNAIEVNVSAGVSILYRTTELIYVSTNEMSFVGLDSNPGDPVAEFYHNDDSATFTIDIPKATDYTIVLHAHSWIMSAIELVVDGESKGITTFFDGDWSYIDLGTFYLNNGFHEIKIISREGGDLGDTDAVFDQVAFWPK